VTDDGVSSFHIDVVYVYYVGGFDLRKNVATATPNRLRRAVATSIEKYLLVLAGAYPKNRTRFTADTLRSSWKKGLLPYVVLLGAVSEADNARLNERRYSGHVSFTYEGFGCHRWRRMR
jgi:hypothetical protein